MKKITIGQATSVCLYQQNTTQCQFLGTDEKEKNVFYCCKKNEPLASLIKKETEAIFKYSKEQDIPVRIPLGDNCPGWESNESPLPLVHEFGEG